MNTLQKWMETKRGRMAVRTTLYVITGLIGVALLFYCYDWIYCVILENTVVLKDSDVFKSTLAIFLLTFPIVTFNWLLKNQDQLQQFKDTQQQHEDASKQIELNSQQQNETLFSNALQLLFKKDDIQARSVGLKELSRLRQAGAIETKRINEITYSGLDMKDAKLEMAKLKKADLSRANLEKAALMAADLREAIFVRANLLGANLLGADLQNAYLREANLQGAQLLGANLPWANLQEAKLQGAKLRWADLRWAKLQGANLTNTNLEEAKLRGAVWNDETKFPDGFDPKEHGMIHEKDWTN